MADPNGRHSNQNWLLYVRRVTSGSKLFVVAEQTGLDQVTISRWLKHGIPGRAVLVAQFARAYPESTTVLEAYRAAGFLDEFEARAGDAFQEQG